MSIINKAEASKRLFLNLKKYESAMMIAGDTIYEQSLEIDELTNKLQSYGDYDENEINEKVQIKKLNTTNENKNRIIRERLRQTLSRAKAVTGTE